METLKAFIKHGEFDSFAPCTLCISACRNYPSGSLSTLTNDNAGKQARVTQPQAEPTTHVSPITAHQQRAAKTESNTSQRRADEQNMAHQAQKDDASRTQKAGGKKVDPDTLARMVAEDNESKGKLPRYPGLERWRLIEKMGDGAFSNVYKAVDLEGSAGEVAIKVVRKFEMNSSQVSTGTSARLS